MKKVIYAVLLAQLFCFGSALAKANGEASPDRKAASLSLDEDGMFIECYSGKSLQEALMVFNSKASGRMAGMSPFGTAPARESSHAVSVTERVGSQIIVDKGTYHACITVKGNSNR